MATPQSNPAQPKINQRLLQRTAIGLVLLAVIFGGYRWVQEQKGDFDRGGQSVGMVAAIRRQGDGQQAVLIHPDGKIVATKSWRDGVVDREPTWSPDGRFLYFCSDRDESTFHVFRWNPEKDDAESRTQGGTSRSNPTFGPGDTGETLLMIAGGAVRELDPRERKAPQILPPSNGEIAQSGDPEGGAEGSFSAVYGSLGKSFRVARYFPDHRYIAAIMRREEGELLMVQDLQPGANGKVPTPRPVAAGDRIEFDVNPKENSVAFTVQNFRWPDPKAAPEQFRQGNRVTVPFRNVVGVVEASGKQTLIGASRDDKVAFASPRIAPDGARLILTVGAVEDGSLRPSDLLTLPYREGGLRDASQLVRGEVYEPSWSADGRSIVYAKRAGGKRDVYTITAEGASETNLTKGQGDFMTPLFSPMAKE